MSSHVLVVDDIAANRRLLQAKLTHEYYEVSTASNGEEAIKKAKEETPDIILLDVMMPGIDGFEVCTILKNDPQTEHIPIVMVTALGDREDRLRGLNAGADDFLMKPIDDFALMSRIRALTKYKLVIDELRQREASGRRIGVIEGNEEKRKPSPANVLIIDDNERQSKKLAAILAVEHNPISFLESRATGEFNSRNVDVMMISLSTTSFDPLRLCAHFKSNDRTRDLPIIVMTDIDDEAKAVKALDLGASDVLMRPIDPEELSARVRTQYRKKRYLEAMRRRLDQSMELAVTDQLTGLHNRRYMNNQLGQFLKRANMGAEPVSIMIADIDRFKSVNDTYGHDVGDEVLVEFARRIGENVRPGDIACRQGGEEFVVVMPNTEGDLACAVAERLRRHVAGEPFKLPATGERLEITVSLGVATSEPSNETIETLLKKADEALYRAKTSGRNRVEAAAA